MTEHEVYESVQYHDLYRVQEFDNLSLHEFELIYNGYGPDNWPAKLRGAITWIYRNFREVAAVHDVGYYFSDGSIEGWEQTMRRWKQNTSIMINARYPLSKPWKIFHRVIAYTKLRIAYRALQLGSLEFYQDAYKNVVDKIPAI